MTRTTTRLGVCPNCGMSIPAHRLLAEAEEPRTVYAECPDCWEVVSPVSSR